MGIIYIFTYTAGSASYSCAKYPFKVDDPACSFSLCFFLLLQKKKNSDQNSVPFLDVPSTHLVLLIIQLWLHIVF
jgi:hypothetical protein